jgi:hypothetical protein
MAEVCYALWTFALPSGACADWYSGTWSAFAVAVAAGSYGFSEWRSRRRQIEDEKAIGCQIGVKIINLLNQSHTILRHFEIRGSCSLDGSRSKSTEWNKLHPMVGLTFDESLPLTPLESNLLLTAGAAQILSEMALAIHRLKACTLTMHEYKSKYEDFQKILPLPKATDGAGFIHQLTPEQFVQHHMHTLILNTLINGMYEMIEECFTAAQGLMTPFNEAMKRNFRVEKFMTFEPTEAGSKIFGLPEQLIS